MTLSTLETATLPELKKFAATNSIAISGDLDLEENWAGCIEKWLYVQAEAAACLADEDEDAETV